MYKTLDARHVFHAGRLLSQGTCRIRIYETFRPEPGQPTVIVASQLAGSAPSVTNLAEDIATEVVRMQRARRCLEPGAPRHPFVWVEHYPAGTLGLVAGGYFQRVRFQPMADGRLACPKWDRPISQEDVEALLLGCPLRG